MIAWPNTLIEDIARRNCVIFLGSGISCNSTNADGEKPKSWRSLLENGANTHIYNTDLKDQINRKVSEGDYLLACELLKRGMGAEPFSDYLKNEYLDKQFDEADIHKTIFELDSRIVISPNIDEIYETYARSQTKGTTIVKTYKDNDITDVIRTGSFLIIKTHGSISHPHEVIFTSNDYAQIRNKYREFYDIINALILTRTFLFLGAGLNDPDIKLLMENYSFRYKYSRKHQFVIPSDAMSSEEETIYSDLLNMNFLKYDRADEHQELKESLVELVAKVSAKRNELSGKQNW